MRAEGIEMPAALDDDFVYRSSLDEVLASLEVQVFSIALRTGQ